MKTILKGGTVVTADGGSQADMLIDGEKISQVSPGISLASARTVDVTGKLLLPGGVDVHTHFDLPMFGTVSSDDHYTGTKAAAFGGTTTVMDFASFDAPTVRASVDAWHAKAAKAAVDYSTHFNLSKWNPEIGRQLPGLRQMGISTIKVFTAYNGRLRISDAAIYQTLRIARDSGMMVLAHCENGDVIDTLVSEALAAGHTSPEWHAKTRPKWGAVESALRFATMAIDTGATAYIVHMNAAGEADMLRYAREQGGRVMGETCPQYLFFTEDDLRRPDGAKWICSPPMRSRVDNAGLWSALEAGTIQVVATDHCPFYYDGSRAITYEGTPIAIPGKELGAADFTKIPNGLPGVEDRLPIMWTTGVNTGRFTPSQFVALTSTNPARIFGLYPQKGALLPGSDADIVVWDPAKKVRYGVAVAHQRTDYNLYEGWDLVGYPEQVYLRGTCIVSGDQWLGKPGGGKFLPRGEGQFM